MVNLEKMMCICALGTSASAAAATLEEEGDSGSIESI
jgi:hypothetical protein